MILNDINVILSSVTDFIYYHGTDTEEVANKIMQEGLVPPPIPEHKHKMTPIDNSIYLTPHIGYALIYALGGNIAGNKAPDNFINKNRYGYVFGVNIKQIRAKMSPDEDSVGDFLYHRLNKYDYISEDGNRIQWSHIPYELEQIASKYLTIRQWEKVKVQDDYADLCVAGKKLLKYMSDELKQKLIDLGAHVSYVGNLIPEYIWKVDKEQSELYKADGSNFFRIAEKIK